MATSKIVLPNGTIITVEGSPEEIKAILSHYEVENKTSSGNLKKSPSKKTKTQVKKSPADENATDAVMQIVNSIKEVDEAENIETNILDRSSQIDRILLPLYISEKHHGNEFKLTTGEMAKILMELGVPIGIANISNAIKSGASKYVVGDKARKKGQPVRYKLTRRGSQYISAVIEGADHGK